MATFIDGIGPPLEQIREDAIEGLLLPGTESRGPLDTLALIREVTKLHDGILAFLDKYHPEDKLGRRWATSFGTTESVAHLRRLIGEV